MKKETKKAIADIVREQVQELIASGKPVDGQIHVANIQDVKQTLKDMDLGPKMQANGWIMTRQGSVINPSNDREPWIELSPEMIKFAEGVKQLVNREDKSILTKVLVENTDPSGGYLVPEEFQAMMVQYDTEPAAVWPRATIWPMNTDKLGFPKLAQRPDEDAADFDHFAGVIFTWTEEGGSKTETEPSFEFMELIAHELSGYTAVSDILLQDSPINLINFLTGLFRRAWVWYTDRSFLRGNGARCPLGVILDPAILTVARATANAVTYADILDMDSKLPSVFDQGAVWMCNKKVMNSLRGQVDTNGQPVLQQFYHAGPGGIGMTQITMMLGYPVIVTNGKTYNLGTKGDIVLGNWKWYYIGDRRRFSLDTSSHYLFRNNRTALRVVGRLDGLPAFSEAFVVLDDVGSGS